MQRSWRCTVGHVHCVTGLGRGKAGTGCGGPLVEIMQKLRCAIKGTPFTRRGVTSIRKHFARMPGRQWTALREPLRARSLARSVSKGNRTAHNQSAIQMVRNIEHSISSPLSITREESLPLGQAEDPLLLHSLHPPSILPYLFGSDGERAADKWPNMAELLAPLTRSYVRAVEPPPSLSVAHFQCIYEATCAFDSAVLSSALLFSDPLQTTREGGHRSNIARVKGG